MTTKKKVPPKSKRYPIFPVRLRPEDKDVMASVGAKYGLKALSDSIRVSTRIVQMLDLPFEKVRKLNAQFEAENPGALEISIDLASQ